MDFIKKIVQRSLKEKIAEHSEIGSLETPIQDKSVDAILYSYKEGNQFASYLKNSLKALEEIQFSEYFPRSEDEEEWIFEDVSHSGELIQIKITHRKSGDKPTWSLTASSANIGSYNNREIQLDAFYEGPDIIGLSNFVRYTNKEQII
ncbi:MAG: hypothetical protein H6620_12760 [Halobacteriovoraceae bacterium]|nr:hypothetical protein [Halobacteriovoraceae bacterium]